MLVMLGILAALTTCSRATVISSQSQNEEEKKNPLIDASKRGDLSEVKKLLANGADANTRDTKGHTPLQCAVSSGNVEVAQALLVAGADVNACANDGYTALHAAAIGSDIPDSRSVTCLRRQCGCDDNGSCNPR